MRNCFSNSTTWRLRKRTTAALRILFRQLHAFLAALRSCASLVSVFGCCHAACIASVAACSSASVWGSPLQPRPGLLLFLGVITNNSAVRMIAATNLASTSFTLLSPGGFALRCLPTAVATSCQSWGSVTRHIRSGPLAVSSKMAKELDGCGNNIVVQNEMEGGLGVHRNVPHEFAIKMSR